MQNERILRRPEVRHITGLTDSAIEREMKAARFPKPIKLSPDPKARAVGWPESVIRAWVAGRIAAAQQAAAA
jgi:prophage regulatory protein